MGKRRYMERDLDWVAIGARIRTLREAAGLSVATMARAAGVSAQFIHAAEPQPPPGTRIGMAALLGFAGALSCSVEDLLGEQAVALKADARKRLAAELRQNIAAIHRSEIMPSVAAEYPEMAPGTLRKILYGERPIPDEMRQRYFARYRKRRAGQPPEERP